MAFKFVPKNEPVNNSTVIMHALLITNMLPVNKSEHARDV